MYKMEKSFDVIKGIVPDFSKCGLEKNTVWEYDYNENEQILEIPCKGKYKLEVWGAEGGKYNSSVQGGFGGFATGEINLTKGVKLYIYVGGKGTGDGTHISQSGGYNGGGDAIVNSDSNTRQSSGGGATHIALVSGLLSTLEEQKGQILIVAGGGGGSGWNAAFNGVASGSGGGFKGVSGAPFYNTMRKTYDYSMGGSQESGGYSWQSNNSTPFCQANFGLGGGPNSYGGGGGGFYGGSCGITAGGGSGYIGNELLTNKIMYCYNCTESEEDTTKTKTTTNVSEEATSEYAKIGNGYAKITYLGK